MKSKVFGIGYCISALLLTLTLSGCAKIPNPATANNTADKLGTSPISRVWDARYGVMCYYYVFGYGAALSCIKVQ